eukprot:462702_1
MWRQAVKIMQPRECEYNRDRICGAIQHRQQRRRRNNPVTYCLVTYANSYCKPDAWIDYAIGDEAFKLCPCFPVTNKPAVKHEKSSSIYSFNTVCHHQKRNDEAKEKEGLIKRVRDKTRNDIALELWRLMMQKRRSNSQLATKKRQSHGSLFSVFTCLYLVCAVEIGYCKCYCFGWRI